MAGIRVGCITIEMKWTGVYRGTVQVRGRPPVASIGWMCTQVHDEHSLDYHTACYLSYDGFEQKLRLGIDAPAVPNTGLVAWVVPDSCPSELCLLKFDLSSPP